MGQKALSALYDVETASDFSSWKMDAPADFSQHSGKVNIPDTSIVW